ncbi:hypothetical protein FOA52_003689 [Chlamydomonas sp. UWO 241]|nr:hypothetical protein FOA52_003689 [Chlamydomonas sp. UWO 241]
MRSLFCCHWSLVVLLLAVSACSPACVVGHVSFRKGCRNAQIAQDLKEKLGLDCGGASYQWILPESNLDEGLPFHGDVTRLRLAMHRLLVMKQNLTLGFIGGSVTWGYGIIGPSETRKIWPLWTDEVLKRFLPADAAARVTVVNGAISATGSTFFSLCHQERLSPNVDVVLMDFAINDHDPSIHPHAVERTLRSVARSYANFPAQVLFNFYNWFECVHGGIGHYGSPIGHPTMGDRYLEIGAYYRVAVASIKHCCYKLMKGGEDGFGVDGFRVDRPIRVGTGCVRPIVTTLGQHANLTQSQQAALDVGREGNTVDHSDDTLQAHSFFNDGPHPGGETGARAAGEIAAALLLGAAASLVWDPVTPEEAAAAEQVLPPPLFPNNYAVTGSSCVVHGQLRNLTVRNEGFVFNDEGRAGKWGWVSDLPGSSVDFKLAVVYGGGGGNAKIAVHVLYLQSYANMGQGLVSCVSGCVCNDAQFDGHKDYPRHSFSVSISVLVTQHPECVIRIMVLNNTTAPDGGRKVKVNGFTLSSATHEQQQALVFPELS